MLDPTNVTLPAALAAWDAGLCVIRSRADGTKAPLGYWEQYQTERPTRAEVEAWFAKGHPGIGIVTGSVSGDVEMFELEGRFVETSKDEFIERCNAAGLELLLRRIATGYHWGSPSGGRNFLYRVDGVPVDGNTKLARNEQAETLIETRGEGGFVILPPSHGPVHPSGAPWLLRAGGFEEIPTITADERAALFAVAASFDAGPAIDPVVVPPRPRAQPAPHHHGKIGDSWIDAVVAHLAQEPLQDLLEQYGWTTCYTDRHGRVLMRRPGKTEGVSGSINLNGRLHVFSTSTPFAAGMKRATTYDHLDVIAAYEHRGDRKAAARAEAEASGILAAWQREQTPVVAFDPTVDPDTGEIASDFRNLPDEFWTARPELAHIRQAAHSRSIAADAVLGAVLCRIVTLIPPTMTLPPIVGGAASLNLYVGIVARSGSGKSTAAMIAGELVPFPPRPDIVTNGLGSGEGIIEQYLELILEDDGNGKKKSVKRQKKTAALVTLDEGQALAEMGNRQGATLLPILRSMWTGASVGNANATQERYRNLDAHTYRLALLSGFQPEYAHDIIADATGGTPQRFVFLHGIDAAVEHANEEWPGPLDFKPPPTITGGVHLGVDPDIAAQIRTRFRLGQAGKLGQDELDSHADLWRLKIAGVLAVIDKRDSIRQDDWELSGMLWKTSRAVRAWVIAIHRAKLEQAEKATTAKIVNRAAAVEQTNEQRALESGAKSIGRRTHALGMASSRDLARAVASKHRALASVDDMIDHAVSKGWIVAVPDGFKPGESKPT